MHNCLLSDALCLPIEHDAFTYNDISTAANSLFKRLQTQGAFSPPVPNPVPQPKTYHHKPIANNCCLPNTLCLLIVHDDFTNNDASTAAAAASSFSVHMLASTLPSMKREIAKSHALHNIAKLPDVHDVAMNNSASMVAAVRSLVHMYPLHNAILLLRDPDEWKLQSLSVLTRQRNLSEFCAIPRTSQCYETHVPTPHLSML